MGRANWTASLHRDLAVWADKEVADITSWYRVISLEQPICGMRALVTLEIRVFPGAVDIAVGSVPGGEDRAAPGIGFPLLKAVQLLSL